MNIPRFMHASPAKLPSVVLVRGVLRGMGRESTCEMLAYWQKHPETHRTVYSRCSVIGAASDLPDGEYTVAFRGGLAVVRREGGLWLPDGVQKDDAA
jgi:hypothetical protein